MLCNPRTPASVLRSQRNATLPAVDLTPGSGGAEAAFDKVSKLVRGLRQDHAAVKVLHINGAPPRLPRHAPFAPPCTHLHSLAPPYLYPPPTPPYLYRPPTPPYSR